MSSTQNLIENVPSTSALATSKPQGGVQSLEIGLAILDILIDANAPMMLKEIGLAAQMPPAKTHRYLVSLIRKGYARQLEDGRYGLGERVNALGHTGLNKNTLLEHLTTVANEIKNILNCAVQIAKWFSEGPIIIQSVEPDSPISIITRIGSRMPLTTSATGQLFASYQPEAVIEPLVIAEWQSSGANPTATSVASIQDTELANQWQQFTELQADIRSQGYATVTGDMLMGVNAITIPVLLPQALNTRNPSINDTLLEYAITVIGTSEQLPMLEKNSAIQQILEIARRYQIA